MRALLKTGELVEIDTSWLFNDQYNTLPSEGGSENGRRILDGEVARIYDDARVGMGKCRYCGAMVRRGEEERHFAEREAQGCEKCFWWQKKLLSTEYSNPVKQEFANADGTITTKTTRTTTDIWVKECAYKNRDGNHADCDNKECRAHGIEWFTPENTFFLRYQHGFDPIPAERVWNADFEEHFNYAEYYKKIGTYTLSAWSYGHKNIDSTGVDFFELENARRDYKFRLEDDTWFIFDRRFGWKQHKTLEGIPDAVIAKVREIMKAIAEGE